LICRIQASSAVVHCANVYVMPGGRFTGAIVVVDVDDGIVVVVVAEESGIVVVVDVGWHSGRSVGTDTTPIRARGRTEKSETRRTDDRK
jgi:hypothetical protein